MAKKNWISKSEEKRIIRAYEGFKGEIVPYGEPGSHMYEITTVRKSGIGSLGLISIKAEYDPMQKYPRILVVHSDAKGKRTFTDVWDRDVEGKIYWRFRNPVNVPLSDREAIEDIKSELASTEGTLLILQRKYQEIIDTQRLTKPAGRKPDPQKLDEQAMKVKDFLDQGLGEKEITAKLGISRATFYRMKRRHSE